MTLEERIRADVAVAMKARESEKVETLRTALAALKQVVVDTRKSLEPADELGIIQKMIKIRREAFADFEKAGRADLCAREKFQIELLSGYLPTQMTEDEIRAFLREQIATLGLAGPGDLSKLMKAATPALKGKADGRLVADSAKALLAGMVAPAAAAPASSAPAAG